LLQAVDGGMETFGEAVPAIEFSSGPGGALANFDVVALLLLPFNPKVGNDGIRVLEQPLHATSARAAVMPTASRTRMNSSLVLVHRTARRAPAVWVSSETRGMSPETENDL
jgi:hypothetical protein